MEHLGAHVVGRASSSGRHVTWREHLSQTEIDHLHAAGIEHVKVFVEDHDVFRLEVLVHHPVGVTVRDGRQYTPQHPRCTRLVKRLTCPCEIKNDVEQLFAVDELENEVQILVVLERLVHTHNVRVVEPSQHVDLVGNELPRTRCLALRYRFAATKQTHFARAGPFLPDFEDNAELPLAELVFARVEVIQLGLLLLNEELTTKPDDWWVVGLFDKAQDLSVEVAERRLRDLVRPSGVELVEQTFECGFVGHGNLVPDSQVPHHRLDLTPLQRLVLVRIMRREILAGGSIKAVLALDELIQPLASGLHPREGRRILLCGRSSSDMRLCRGGSDGSHVNRSLTPGAGCIQHHTALGWRWRAKHWGTANRIHHTAWRLWPASHPGRHERLHPATTRRRRPLRQYDARVR
mmetsp:Transcript_1259/g.2783  ORF Transcript_1259/g.2783 Transcript_1259/m.2783 type:complete len:406 (+) Transcript_1259:1300-2517(+)